MRLFIISIFLLFGFQPAYGFEDANNLAIPGAKLTQITERGGRLAWYHGPEHELIAYDAMNEGWLNFKTEVYVMQPDGSGKRCVTCNMKQIRKGFVGQPEWLDAKHLVIQVENETSDGGAVNHISFGLSNDLWVIAIDGSFAQKIWSTPQYHAALHPQVSDDGRTLMFSERRRTHKQVINPIWFDDTGGENHWDGWRIHLADIQRTRDGGFALANHRTLFDHWGGFFETHGFLPGGRIVFSYTKGGKNYVDDVYTATITGREVRNLTQSPSTWEEHGSFSPSKNWMTFISSRFDKEWRFPGDNPKTLRTELFMKNMRDGKVYQLTQFNSNSGKRRILCSDFDWDKSGSRIAFQVAPAGRPQISPQIWMIEFPGPQ